jgi:hypothetical protein
MAEVVALDLAVNDGGSQRTVGELKKSVRDLTKELENTERGTKRYRELTQELGDAKNEFKDFKKEVMAFDSGARADAFASVGNSLAGGFAAATGAAALFGVESENVQAAILKVQAATAIAQGVQSVADGMKQAGVLKNILLHQLEQAEVKKGIVVTKGATIAQRIWNLTIAANPLVALGIAIAAVAAAVYAFTRATEETIDTQKELEQVQIATAKSIERTNFALKDSKVLMGDINKLNKDQIQGKLEVLDVTLKVAEAEYLAASRNAKIAQEEFDKIEQNYLAILDLRKKLIEARETIDKKDDENKSKRLDDLAKKEQQEADKRREFEKKLAEQELADKIELEDKNKAFIEQIREERRLATLSDQERQLEDAQRLYDQLISAGMDRLEAYGIFTQEKIRIEREAADSQAEIDLLRTQDELEVFRNIQEAKLVIAQGSVDSLAAIADLAASNGENMVAAQKAIGIAQLAVDSGRAFSSMMAGVEAASAASGPAYPFVKAGLYATGIAQILSNVARAKKLLGSSGSVGVSAPRINSASSTNTPQRVDSYDPSKQGKETVQAFVVESEMTGKQNRVSRIKKRSKI